MALTKTVKQGYERYYIHGDFTAVMEAAETITASTIAVADNTGQDATADIVVANTAYDEGFKQYVQIQGGIESKSPYKITIRIETSKGNRWEVDGLIAIKEV